MKIKLDIFEGPLDLLLYLVKRDHLNICDIPIVKITEQYIEYLELMKLLDLNIAGEFLVMAATLMQIKSKMLLPQEGVPKDQEEIDPRQELMDRLLEYQKFKEVALSLQQLEAERKNVFVRPKSENQEPRETEVYFEASVFDLLSAFSKALKEVPKELFYEVIKDEFTVEEKIHWILHRLLESETLDLSEIFTKCKNKLEIVATFLAILELIRLKEITIKQSRLFENIIILRNTENITPHDRKTQ